MSLFGDSDAPSPRGAKSSLFDDGTAAAPGAASAQAKPDSSIFAESGTGAADADGGSSPWDFTPRKSNARRGGDSVVKTLLADADVPELYVDAWDTVARGRASMPSDEARELLGRSSVGAGAEGKIWSIVCNGRGEAAPLGRAEFNVLLALVGLAQEGEELSLDAVDERKASLPRPALPSLRRRQEEEQDEAPATPRRDVNGGERQGGTARARSNGGEPSSFEAGFGESDPWASPAMHKGHKHTNGGSAPQRTTSAFTTSAAEPIDSPAGNGAYGGQGASGGDGGSWGGGGGSFNAGTSNSFGGDGGGGGGGAGGVSGDGFRDDEGVARRPAAAQRSQTSKGVEEVITVSLLEEKEGMFMFQHRNYEVASVRRNSKVIRRYSDFVWLLDCLHKRYPFRQLPLLPPKRVAINGNHIAADTLFLEKRRRGLARFANALIRHPILREEQLVVMFLSVPTELAVWRKQATISVQEEFVGKNLPSNLEDGLPQNLQETFDTVRSGVRRGADLYISLCNLVERLIKREEAMAGEYGRFSMALTSLTETTREAFAIDTNDVPLLNEGIKGTAKHLSATQGLLEDEGRGWEQGLLEDLKTVRDGLVSMRELFDRKDRLARDNIPQLERRIQQNEQKLQGVKAKGDAAKPGEAEKVEIAIVNDKQSIVNQHARGVFIKECVRDELVYFQATIYRISRLHQDWAQERVKYAELVADNFRGMVDAVDGMPLGD